MSASLNARAVANRGALTVCVMMATIMQALDITIANVALPYIQARSRRARTRSTGC
jgi:DHA2 family multidrug resistance protein